MFNSFSSSALLGVTEIVIDGNGLDDAGHGVGAELIAVPPRRVGYPGAASPEHPPDSHVLWRLDQVCPQIASLVSSASWRASTQ